MTTEIYHNTDELNLESILAKGIRKEHANKKAKRDKGVASEINQSLSKYQSFLDDHSDTSIPNRLDAIYFTSDFRRAPSIVVDFDELPSNHCAKANQILGDDFFMRILEGQDPEDVATYAPILSEEGAEGRGSEDNPQTYLDELLEHTNIFYGDNATEDDEIWCDMDIPSEAIVGVTFDGRTIVSNPKYIGAIQNAEQNS